MAGSRIVVLGIFVADMAFRAERPPRIGETILGSGFLLGPGGKGSNQSVGIGPGWRRCFLHQQAGR